MSLGKDKPDTGLAAGVNLPSVRSDAEATAVRIVSNLPEGRRWSPNDVQAQPSRAVLPGGLHDDEDMRQLEAKLAKLEEVLDRGTWDDMHGASLICSTVHAFRWSCIQLRGCR